MKKLISALLIIVTVLSFCGCGKKLTNTQPEGAIISNGGISTQKGDWIYLIYGAMPELAEDAVKKDTRARLFRVKADGSELSQVTEKKVINFHVYEDMIFYTSPTETRVKLYKINIDGTKNKKLLTLNDQDYIAYGEKGMAVVTEEKLVYFDYETLDKTEYKTGKITEVALSESYIYYYVQSKQGMNRIELATGRTETLCDTIGDLFYVSDSEIMFLSSRILYRLNTDTLELTQISETYYKSAMLVEGTRTLLLVESSEDVVGLYALSADNVAGRPVEEGGNVMRTTVNGSAVTHYQCDGKNIYYAEAETGDVYSVDFTGNNKKKLATLEGITRLDLTGDVLVLHDSIESGKVYIASTTEENSLRLIKEAE